MPLQNVENLGPGRTAILKLIEQGLDPDDLVAQSIRALNDPDITRTQAGRAIGDVINHLGQLLPQGATELLGQVIAGKPRRPGPGTELRWAPKLGDNYGF